MDSVPKGILCTIFSFISFDSWSSTKRVCKRWNSEASIIFDPSIKDNVAILRACAFGFTKAVEYLLKDSRINPGVNDNQPIIAASGFGHADIVSLLLRDTRVDPTAQDHLAIRIAVDMHNTEVVRRLLEDQRVDPSAKHNNTIRKCCHTGSKRDFKNSS